MSLMEWLLTFGLLVMFVTNLVIGKWLTNVVESYKDLSKDYAKLGNKYTELVGEHIELLGKKSQD